MADLLDLLKACMTDEVLDQLGSRIGVKDRKKTNDVASGAFSVLMDAMQRKAKGDKGSVWQIMHLRRIMMAVFLMIC